MSDYPVDRVGAIIKYTVWIMEELIRDGELHPGYLGGSRLSEEARLEAQALVNGEFDITAEEIQDCTKYIIQWSTRNARNAARQRKARAAAKLVRLMKAR